MKWDLSFCTAEIEGNELIIQLKQKYRTIKQSFKFNGKYFKFRSILENFGYDIFRKALKRQIVSLKPERVEQFKAFFNEIQTYETAGSQARETGYAESRPAELWKVDASERETKIGGGLVHCTNCGAKLPENLDDVRFCPECGARIES